MEHKLKYFIFFIDKPTTLKDFNILLSAINTQAGIGIVRSEDSTREASIMYANNPLRADIKFTSKVYTKKHKNIKVPNKRILLSTEIADNLSVNFVKEVGRIQGLKVFSPELGYFLPKDPNLHDCNTGIENSKELNLLEKFGYKPLFWLWNSFTYFVQNNTDKKIYIINGHLLRHLLENDVEKEPADFSTVVAQNLPEFVRTANIGLIPTDYYKCVDSDIKFYNMSSIDVNKYKSKVYLDIVPYTYDKKSLEYKKAAPEKLVKREIKTLQNIDKTLKDVIESESLNKNLDYTGAIIEKEIKYRIVNKKYVPKLNVALFL